MTGIDSMFYVSEHELELMEMISNQIPDFDTRGLLGSSLFSIDLAFAIREALQSRMELTDLDASERFSAKCLADRLTSEIERAVSKATSDPFDEPAPSYEPAPSAESAPFDEPAPSYEPAPSAERTSIPKPIRAESAPGPVEFTLYSENAEFFKKLADDLILSKITITYRPGIKQIKICIDKGEMEAMIRYLRSQVKFLPDSSYGGSDMGRVLYEFEQAL